MLLVSLTHYQKKKQQAFNKAHSTVSATRCCTVLTLEFTSVRSRFLVSFRSLDKQRKNATEPEYVDELLAVVGALGTDHCVIKNFECTCARHFLLPVTHPHKTQLTQTRTH